MIEIIILIFLFIFGQYMFGTFLTILIMALILGAVTKENEK